MASNSEFNLQFCRACACKLKEPPTEIENNPQKPELPLLIKRYMPEFDVKVGNAYLCKDCVSILYEFHNFKRKSLRTEENLRLHIRQHPEVKTVDINQVFEKSHTKVNDNVTRTADVNNKKSINCKRCNRTFLYKTTLLLHLIDYHGRERYKCNECSKEFLLKNRYNKHVEYHKKPDSNRFVCTICNYVYQSYSSLRTHNTAIHKSDGQITFGCKICTKSFVEKEKLEAHMRVHTGEKPFKSNV